MVNDELLEFIKKRLGEGADEPRIRNELTSSGGWTEADLNEGFSQVHSSAAVSSTSPSETQAVQQAEPRAGHKKAITMISIAVAAVLILGASYAYHSGLLKGLPGTAGGSALTTAEQSGLNGQEANDLSGVENEDQASTAPSIAEEAAKNDTKSAVQQPKSGENWSTYANVQFAFQISYPQGWSARESAQGVLVRNYTNVLQQPATPIEIDITYFQNDNPKKLDAAAYVSDKYSVLKSLFDKAVAKQNLVVGNQQALKYTWEGDYSGSGLASLASTRSYEYFVMRGADVISISYVLPKDMNDSVAAEIVSTLKFGTFDQKAYGDVLQSENSDVIGTDADKDGVWDYIEAWINTTYAGKPNTITSLKMLAKEFQFKMLNYRDKEAIVNESHKAFGIDCLLKAEPEDGGDILDEFEAQMMNTAARTKAYLSADSQLGGQVFNMPSEATVTQECGF